MTFDANDTVLTSIALVGDSLQYTDEFGAVTSLYYNSDTTAITTLVDNGNGTFTYTDETGVPMTFDAKDTVLTSIALVGDSLQYTDEFGAVTSIYYNSDTTAISTLVDNGNGTFTYTDETGVPMTFDANDTVLTSIALVGDSLQYTDEFGAVTSLYYNSDTTAITTLVDNGNGTFTYTDETGVPMTFDANDTVLTSIALVGDSLQYTDEFGAITSIYYNSDTTAISTLVDNGNGTFTYTDETGVPMSFDAKDTVLTSIALVGDSLQYTDEAGVLTKIFLEDLDSTNEKIDTIYMTGDSITIIEGADTLYANINDNDWNINTNGTGLEAAAATDNFAGGDYAIAAGQSDTALGYTAVVAGGYLNKTTDNFTVVSGGRENTATANSATVGGGYLNNATSTSSTVGGGQANNSTANSSTVSGGITNTANSAAATIGGGQTNIASGSWSTVGGGRTNVTSGNYATISGGRNNTVAGGEATISGGVSNIASGSMATVGGGGLNTASGNYSIISGGYNNTTSGALATVSGGELNTAAGAYSTVSGGYRNIAQSYGEWVGGLYSTNYVPISTTIFQPTDRIFNVGNGTSNVLRSDAFTILKNGNTGIGINTPTHRLDVNGEARIRTITDTTDFAHLLVPNTNGVVKKVIFDTVLSKIADSSEWIDGAKVGLTPGAIFARKALAKGDTVVIDTSGNVGIGLTNSTFKLDVNGDIKGRNIVSGFIPNYSFLGSGLYLSNESGNSFNNFRIDGFADDLAIIAYSLPGSNAGTSISFKTSTAGLGANAANRMLIDSIGNVGIGTTAPETKFVVQNGVSTNFSLNFNGFDVTNEPSLATLLAVPNSQFGGLIEGGTNGHLVLGIKDNESSDGLLIASGSGNYMTDSVYDNAILFARADGNVGISTMAPSNQLHIAGGTNPIRLEGLQSTITNDTSILITDPATGVVRYIHIDSIKGEEDADFYRAGTTSVPTNINDSIYTMGNVAIGTTTPTARLTIQRGTSSSSLNLDGFDGVSIKTDLNKLLTSGGSKFGGLIEGGVNGHLVLGIRENQASDGLTIVSGSGNYHTDSLYDKAILTAKADGKVGIGTIAPDVKLHVRDSIDGVFNGLIIDNKKGYGVGSGTNETSRISMSLSSGTTSGINAVQGYIESGITDETNSGEGFMAFGTRTAATPTERMRILNNGNTGIGTIAPSNRLHIAGTNNPIRLEGLQPTIANDTSILITNPTTGVVRYIHIDSIKGEEDADFFKVGTTSAPTNINDSIYTMGNVGIGTNTPEASLNVIGAIRVGTQTGMNSNLSRNRLEFNRTKGFSYIDQEGDQGALVFRIDNGLGLSDPSSNTMILDSNNNVGIGTIAPTHKLDVNGETRIRTITDTNVVATVLTTNTNGVVKKIAIDSLQNQLNVKRYVSTTVAYSVAKSVDVVFSNPTSGAFDVTLPSAVTYAGRTIKIKRTDNSVNSVTVKSLAGNVEANAPATGYIMSNGYEKATFMSDGTDWWIVTQ
jgi:hypothetical protein